MRGGGKGEGGQGEDEECYISTNIILGTMSPMTPTRATNTLINVPW